MKFQEGVKPPDHAGKRNLFKPLFKPIKKAVTIFIITA
jgi:hypothetical protein